MMSKYVDILQDNIKRAYPAQNKDQYQQINISKIQFQKMYPSTKNYLQNFINVTNLSITFCDLRTLQNFPLLPRLLQLDVSNNSLQGSFQHIMKNKSLEYIDASNNYISDETALLPLKKFRKMSICIASNPLSQQKNTNSNLFLQHVKILKAPKNKFKNMLQKEQNRLKSRNYKMIVNEDDDLSMNFQRKQFMMMSQMRLLQKLSDEIGQNPSQQFNPQRQLLINSRIKNRERMISLGVNDSSEENE